MFVPMHDSHVSGLFFAPHHPKKQPQALQFAPLLVSLDKILTLEIPKILLFFAHLIVSLPIENKQALTP